MDHYIDILISIAVVIGIIFAIVQTYIVRQIKVESHVRQVEGRESGLSEDLLREIEEAADTEEAAAIRTKALQTIHKYISDGASAFLSAEYKILFIFIFCFAILIYILLGSAGTCGHKQYSAIPGYNVTCVEGVLQVGCEWAKTKGSCWTSSIFSTLSFLLGGIASIISGYIGMKIAVYSNVRTSVQCEVSWTEGFNTAFRAGSVMGFSLTALGLFALYITIYIYSAVWGWNKKYDSAELLFEMISGYGLGGSFAALFGRVGGGIYTKAADVGADLVGKVEKGIPEDDPRNPAVIADNVGDNVGDVAGMGADLFGSFAESSCAALVIASVSPEVKENWEYLIFPLSISAAGILVGFVTSFFATSIPFLKVKKEGHIERNLKIQLFVSTLLMTPTLIGLTMAFLPEKFCVDVLEKVILDKDGNATLCRKYSSDWECFGCVVAGLWSGLIIGFYTDYMTSYSHRPVQEVSESCETGAATNIIFGLALGYKSCIVPVAALAITIFISFYFSNMYGVALAALGMLSTMSTALTIDAYGPITDNAGGIAEMTGLSASVRRKTDALDAAGNTTAAVGKGFAIGSASLVSLALFGAFVTKAGIESVNVLKPLTFSGLLVGAMMPYWFSAMTMKSVGKAAKSMVEEVRRQFREHPNIMNETNPEVPDYQRCVAISTNASLKEMIAPGALVMLTPIITGFFLGVDALTGVLAGGLVSGVQMAISASNTGGAWDNAKKWIEKGNVGGKGSESHKAAVVGDTVGDPLKDTSGPSLNILMKLSAIISLVLAPFFTAHSLVK